MKLEASRDYRTVLKEELEARCQRNPRYSLRAFARDLAIAPARLSDVLRGRYGLSRHAAQAIAGRLDWSSHESAIFCDLVESEHARAMAGRVKARRRLRERAPEGQWLTQDAFHAISDWHHYALLELTAVKGFQSDPAWIGKRLGISPHVAVAAIDRLKRLELLAETPAGLRATETFTASPSGVPSDALKKFHKQILEKAMAAIYLQTVRQRDLSSMVLAFEPARMKEASQALRDFRRDFDRRFGAGNSGKAVYCLALQFFRLDESIRGKGRGNA